MDQHAETVRPFLGGKLLIIDEIHKYTGWPAELKARYEAHTEIQFIFSASSAFDIFKAEAYLSRRATVTLLLELSFREFLECRHDVQFSALTLTELLENATDVSKDFNEKAKPVPLFIEYIRNGYFPFLKSESAEATRQKLSAIVNADLENDLAYVQDYSPSTLALALNENTNAGALRETFFVNQLRNAGHNIHLAK